MLHAVVVCRQTIYRNYEAKLIINEATMLAKHACLLNPNIALATFQPHVETTSKF